jgi:hypothetical protein
VNVNLGVILGLLFIEINDHLSIKMFLHNHKYLFITLYV